MKSSSLLGAVVLAAASVSAQYSEYPVQSVATSIPGGCNPAHPGSCPTPSSSPAGYPVGTPSSSPAGYPVGTPSSSSAGYPVATSIPGGCNPAHPGSCPTPSSSSVGYSVATSIPGGCNPAHPGSCPTPSSGSVSTPVATSIPGGCNPAHPGSCPTPSSSSVAKPVTTSIPGGCNPAHPGSCPTPSSSTFKASYVAGNGTMKATGTQTGKLPEFTGAAGTNVVSGALVVLGAAVAYLF